jgi:hypothetical protein
VKLDKNQPLDKNLIFGFPQKQPVGIVGCTTPEQSRSKLKIKSPFWPN